MKRPTGDTCYVALGYVIGEPTIEGSPDCRPGDITISTVHSPGESAYELYGALAHNAQTCGPFQFKRVCCSAKPPALNCEWVGIPEDGSAKCTGGQAEATCGPRRYELVTDRYTNALGLQKCSSGAILLCCDAPDELDQCEWTDCRERKKCEEDRNYIATRGDTCPRGQHRTTAVEGTYTWRTASGPPRPGSTKNTHSGRLWWRCLPLHSVQSIGARQLKSLPQRPSCPKDPEGIVALATPRVPTLPTGYAATWTSTSACHLIWKRYSRMRLARMFFTNMLTTMAITIAIPTRLTRWTP
ncbi:hypothetical protein BDV12DRAFT_181666 [Aspergillus spectabilis]